MQAARLLTAESSTYTHQLELLLRLADGVDRLRRNPPLWKCFIVVNRWVPAWRYNPALSNRDAAEDFLDAVEQVSRWIENNV